MVMGVEDTPMTWLAWQSMMNNARTIQLRVPMPTGREGLYDLADVFYELSENLRKAAKETTQTDTALPMGKHRILSAESRLKLLKAEWNESFLELYDSQITRERESHFKLYAVAQKKYENGTLE